jgi:hypothetical protein
MKALVQNYSYIILIVTTMTEWSMLGGSLVTTAWHVLRLWMEGQPPALECSCKYIE